MSIQSVLAPLFVQVGLTFFMLFWMGRLRLAAIGAHEVKVRDIALGQWAWPAKVTQIANNFHNQLELPILFYVLVALALITRNADLLFVILSWIFVATRLVHAYIFATTNIVYQRFMAFLVGAVVLTFMWFLFAVRIFTDL